MHHIQGVLSWLAYYFCGYAAFSVGWAMLSEKKESWTDFCKCVEENAIQQAKLTTLRVVDSMWFPAIVTAVAVFLITYAAARK